MTRAAISASFFPFQPIAILLAPSAGSVVADWSKRMVIAPPSPPAAEGMFMVNEQSDPTAATPVVSIALTAVALVLEDNSDCSLLALFFHHEVFLR